MLRAVQSIMEEVEVPEDEKVTISVIKADVGGYVGHSAMHIDLLRQAGSDTGFLGEAKLAGTLVDFHVTNCGDDLELIMTHRQGVE